MSNRCAWFLVLLLILASAGPVYAGEVPRGPGFYFSLWKSLLVLVVYAIWLSACRWVDQDAQQVDLDRHAWNGIVFGGGLVGLLIFWLIPFFPLGFTALSGMVLVALLSYVGARNAVVPPSRQVCTLRHFALLVQRWFGINMGVREGKEAKVRRGPEVRFARRWETEVGRDPPRLRKVRGKRGYRTALLLLEEALARRAAEIVLDLPRSKTTVRYRIDGVLHPGDPLPRSQGQAVVRIYRLLAELPDAAQKIQEASFPIEIGKHRGEVRVRLEEAGQGTRISLEIREHTHHILTLEELGLSPVALDRVKYMLTQSRGVLLVAGPDNAGVGTTIRALLQALDPKKRSVMALECPVEHKLPWVDHIPVGRRRGEATAPAVKRVLSNQTAEVVMIGNCDEPEVASLAFQKARDGMLVIGRMSAGDAISALLRLLEFGIAADTINKRLIGVLAQRLVRVLCSECKISYKPNPEVLRKANLPADRIRYLQRPPEESERPRDESGDPQVCEHCGGTGFFGRTILCEILTLTDRMRDLLDQGPTRNALREEAVRAGMIPLADDALRLLLEGTTSAQEIAQYLR